jgi:uroporphyrinogen-III synthase
MAKYKVLSTKKLDPSLIEQAKENGIDIIEQEFISIKPIWNQETFDRIIGFVNNNTQNIVVTSANAVDVLNSYMNFNDTYLVADWNIFCLSGKTKSAILNALLLRKNIVDETSDATKLANKIIAKGVKEIIFFCSNKRREELPTALKKANIKVHEVVLYETAETPATVDKDFDAVLFFSPSGVQSFFSANELNEESICFAIGRTTATSIATFTQNRIVKSPSPDPKKMVEEVIEFFKEEKTSADNY